MNRKLVVCVDGDGHFHAVDVNDRKEVFKALKKIEDGDFWANEIQSYDQKDFNEQSWLDLSDEHWLNRLSDLECRGRMELVEIKNLIFLS